MFVSRSRKSKGDVAEAVITAEAVKLGLSVSRPLSNERYDLVFDVGGRMLRVQCKWGSLKDDVVVVSCRGCWHSPIRGYVRSAYTAAEVDLIAAYCEKLDACYAIPIELVDGQTTLNLRLQPARNGQRAAIHFAANYPLGAVAQLARARDWQSRGRGFESPQLHLPDAPSAIGAEEFRTRLGWYMQRAAGGEAFDVLRRGKPFVRLVPAGA